MKSCRESGHPNDPYGCILSFGGGCAAKGQVHERVGLELMMSGKRLENVLWSVTRSSAADDGAATHAGHDVLHWLNAEIEKAGFHGRKGKEWKL